MPIDIDVQSFAELNNNVTDINNKVTPIQNMVLNAVPAGSNNKISVRRGTVWNIEGEEAYNGQYQELGNISGEVVLALNTTTSRTAIIATITGYTFVTSFGADMLTSHVYTIFLKQNSTGNYAVRWPYGASVLNMVGPDPNQITAVYVVKLPNGKIFVKCEAFQNTSEIGSVIKEFQPPTITYPDEGNAPIGFTWSKMPELAHGGTLSDLYSDWEIASDELYTVLLFSSYNNIVDLYSIDVVLSASGTAYMRTRYGGNIDGEAVVGPWEEAVVEISGIPPLWTPQFIETALWLDAADESTLTLDVSSVSEWRDKSGNERHTTSPLSLKPTHTSSGINGMGSIVFSSGVDPMIVPSFASPTGAEGLLVAFVAEKTGEPVNYSNPLTFGAVNAQWSFVLPKAGVGAANGESDCWFRNRSVDESHVLSVNNFGVNVPRMVVGTLKDSDGMTLLFDGSVEATRAPAVHVLGSAAALTIGSSPDSSYSGNRFQGRIGEIVAIYGDTSLVTLQKIEGYLAHKWSLSANLPDDHPYKYAPPRKFVQDTWTPAEIATALWLDGADSATVTLNGDTVSALADKSGWARSVSQPAKESQPLYDPGAKAIKFDGVDDHLFNTSPFMYAAGRSYVYCVARLSASVSNAYFLAEGLSSANNPLYSPMRQHDGTASFGGGFLRNDAGTIRLAETVGQFANFWTAGQVDILSSEDTGTSFGMRKNGGVATSGSYSRSGSVTLDRFCVGGILQGSFAAPISIDLHELIVLTSAPTADSRQKIEGYLAHKWGLSANLPSDHPYKTAAPPQGTKYVTDNTTLISGNLLEGTTGLTISQVNSDPLNVGIDVAGSNGGLFRIYANGSWTFDPNSEFGALFYPDTADSSVVYHASDGTAEAMATLTVTVTAGAIATDEFWPYVTCLVQPAGGIIADALGSAITLYGSPVISGNMIALDGIDDGLLVADSTAVDIPSGQFTVDFYVRLTAMPTVHASLLAKGANENVTYASFGITINSEGMVTAQICGSSSSPTTRKIITSTNGAISIDTDYHIEYSRDASNVLRLFINGNLVASDTSSTTPWNSSAGLLIGHSLLSSARSRFLQGLISPVRITKGICRHTSNFVPPTRPFPTS